MWTAGRGPSSTPWPTLDRSDVVDQPLAVDLLVIDTQPAAVVDGLTGLVRHGAVHVHHHRRRIALRLENSDAHDVGLADQLAIARLRDDVFDGAVLELVTAVSRRPALRRLPPLAFLRLRVPGHRDWPADPVLAVPFLRTRLELPRWTVAGVVGRRRVRIEVTQPAERCLRVPYTDPDGTPAICVNSERADATVSVERWWRGWQPQHEWRLQGTAHAEVGLRP